jgi:hypothetical protein
VPSNDLPGDRATDDHRRWEHCRDAREVGARRVPRLLSHGARSPGSPRPSSLARPLPNKGMVNEALHGSGEMCLAGTVLTWLATCSSRAMLRATASPIRPGCRWEDREVERHASSESGAVSPNVRSNPGGLVAESANSVCFQMDGIGLSRKSETVPTRRPQQTHLGRDLGEVENQVLAGHRPGINAVVAGNRLVSTQKDKREWQWLPGIVSPMTTW